MKGQTSEETTETPKKRAPKKDASARVAVSEANLTKAAVRLLGQRLVSTEVTFIQNELGATTTQTALDEKIVEVRKMPWKSISNE
jgi:putative heme degradation protein